MIISSMSDVSDRVTPKVKCPLCSAWAVTNVLSAMAEVEAGLIAPHVLQWERIK